MLEAADEIERLRMENKRLSVANAGLLISHRAIQKTFALSERSPDCRTALLVWPHKVHSQGEKTLQTRWGSHWNWLSMSSKRPPIG
jgi:hypothetical protein